MTIKAPPARATISAVPSPSNAVARTGFGELYDYVTNLLGLVGSPEDAREALGVPSKSDLLGGINLIDNSNFAINQRAVTGTVTLAAGAHGHDRWKAGSGGCTYTYAKSGGITTVTITAGTLLQVVNSSSIELGAYTLSHVGTSQMRYINGVGATSAYTTSPMAVLAVGAGAAVNLQVEFGVGTVKKVKLEPGTSATAWQFTNDQTDRLACQNHFARLLSGGASEPLGVGFATSSTSAFCIVPLPTNIFSLLPNISYLSGSSANLAFDAPVGGAISGITASSFGVDKRSIRIVFSGTGFTVGAATIRQNSGTPILVAESDQ